MSHGLLHDNEQKVLRRLAVFVGSASLEAIKQVAADEAFDEWAVLDALGVLVDRSFVTVVDGDGTPRYRLLETPRVFALERLSASGEMHSVRACHATVMRKLFDRGHADLWSGTVGVEETFARLSRSLTTRALPLLGRELTSPRAPSRSAAACSARVRIRRSQSASRCGRRSSRCSRATCPSSCGRGRRSKPAPSHRIFKVRHAIYVELAVLNFRELGDCFISTALWPSSCAWSPGRTPPQPTPH